MTKKQLTAFEKGEIVAMNHTGMTYLAIAKAKNRHPSTISRFLKKFAAKKSLVRAKGGGRPRETTSRTDRRILSLCRENWATSSSQVKQHLDLDISTRTIRRRLKENGLRSYFTVPKPLLTERHMKSRLAWAVEHASWTPEKWNKVMFSDETSISFHFNKKKDNLEEK